ncbi:P-loop containing nucleoside triphosphate hydrolase protein [Aspergillus welwitschiae]|uniref:P-loop containing nucleoside triphosphate hydrolase protein n=1 Tax=Aspergillus welwitschiae TaxID=1341132 RepID=A0A3F3PKM3_9EURO|nr:P-loop containing nucleoside triphosphate hydrolase protein [Aspergillus welwitschiae]RDH26896.1 P-loop containing nucleoside triphosphate hydrolase protein [Aspergillus welwitschiae]
MTVKLEAQIEADIVLAEPALLEKIDRLFACNVGEYINLPQLVVVGDQSSGKSSVLEGLTKLKFPRNSGLCTRFATQIIFRRDPSLRGRKISGSIISTTHKIEKGNASWSMSDAESLNEADFESLISEVHKAMGLSTSAGDNLPTFSSDVFRLEIIGPHENHLSVIDVPGIFKTTTPGLTFKSDIALPTWILQHRRSEIARELDPDGIRTLRILTKPDLVDEGAEEKIIELVEGSQDSEELGWVVVKNLGQKDLQDPSKDRDIAEDIFRHSPPWNRLSKDNYGIEALRARLQTLLASNVRREFPSVRSEVLKRLKECKRALEGLGEERESTEQQRKYLLEIVSKFQRITENALQTNYGSQDAFDDEPELRLATLVANRNALFSDEISTHGHTYAFVSHTHDDDSEDQRNRSVASPANSVCSDADKFESEEECKSIPSRKINSCSDIEDILHDCVPIQDSQTQGTLAWIEKIYRESRGFEIGTFNSTILSSVLKRQSAKWPSFAEGYICDVICVVHTFIKKALTIICNDQRLGQNILSFLLDGLSDKYRQALSTTNFLLRIERDGTPMTQNHYLNSNLQKCRQERITSAAKKSSVSVTYQNGSSGECVPLSDLTQIHHMNNMEQTVQDIHDILKSYYKVARKRFIDNMCMQAVDFYLVTGPEAPMGLFSPAWVYDLSPEQLDDIVGEEASVRRKRKQLKKQLKDLESGRKILV